MKTHLWTGFAALLAPAAALAAGAQLSIQQVQATQNRWPHVRAFVNDEKVQKHDLIDNDIIKLGDIEFEFKCRAMREKRE